MDQARVRLRDLSHLRSNAQPMDGALLHIKISACAACAMDKGRAIAPLISDAFARNKKYDGRATAQCRASGGGPSPAFKKILDVAVRVVDGATLVENVVM